MRATSLIVSVSNHMFNNIDSNNDNNSTDNTNCCADEYIYDVHFISTI